MKTAAQANQHVGLPHASERGIKLFAAYSRRYMRRHFRAFRILKKRPAPREIAHPLVIFLNHAAWWDPLVCLLLSREYFASRASFAPIDAAMLDRYPFFRRLGFFSVGKGTHGGLTFLRTARAILASPGNVLWVTPQGRFMDVRERPLRLQQGLGRLAMHHPYAVFVPLAVEYAFWTEPRPEILVSFGEPISPLLEPARPGGAWTQVFTDALESAQDDLAACSCRRDPNDWLTLNRGKSGVGAIYDAWRHLRARARGETFVADHLPEVRR